MSLMQKKYKRLVKELVFVYSELEFIEDALKEAHYEFESYYHDYCTENKVPIDDLNKKHSEKLEKVFPSKKREVDSDGIVKMEEANTPPKPKVHKVFTKMYRMVTKKIHPDKFADREETPEIKEKINMFKEATKSYGDRNWGKFLDICEKLDIIPTRFEGISTIIRDEISNVNKKIMHHKKMFSWQLYECEEDENCKKKVVERFLQQLFGYTVKKNTIRI